MLSSARLSAYMLAKMPLGAFAGLRVVTLEGERCEVSVPYGWRTTNPFGSIYFGALTMAAELSTGALALMASQASSSPVSVLPIGLAGTFEKKATTVTTFTCSHGGRLFAAVSQALETGEGVTALADTVGSMADGTVAARFTFTWSFKKRSQPR